MFSIYQYPSLGQCMFHDKTGQVKGLFQINTIFKQGCTGVSSIKEYLQNKMEFSTKIYKK